MLQWADQHAPFYPSKCQYKSAVWYTNKTQLEIAKKKVKELSKDGQRKVYVDLESVNAFYRGEDYHQDYLEKTMGGMY